jgi:hypothetical protein
MAGDNKNEGRRRSEAMVRALGLALLLLVGTAAPAVAGSAQAGNGFAGSAPGRADEVGPGGATRAAAAPRSDASALVQSARREGGLRTASHAALGPELRQRPAGPRLPWLRQRKSGVALALSERLALGVGYRHVEGEDLWREFADLGSVDYESHNFVLRAYWRF